MCVGRRKPRLGEAASLSPELFLLQPCPVLPVKINTVLNAPFYWRPIPWQCSLKYDLCSLEMSPLNHAGRDVPPCEPRKKRVLGAEEQKGPQNLQAGGWVFVGRRFCFIDAEQFCGCSQLPPKSLCHLGLLSKVVSWLQPRRIFTSTLRKPGVEQVAQFSMVPWVTPETRPLLVTSVRHHMAARQRALEEAIPRAFSACLAPARYL